MGNIQNMQSLKIRMRNKKSKCKNQRKKRKRGVAEEETQAQTAMVTESPKECPQEKYKEAEDLHGDQIIQEEEQTVQALPVRKKDAPRSVMQALHQAPIPMKSHRIKGAESDHR